MCWDCYDHPSGDPYKIFTQGGVPVEDFDPVFKHRKRSKRNKPKKKRGCPENDFGPHVYVWVTETRYYHKRDERFGFVQDRTRPYTVDVKICCGCEKVTNRKYHW